MNLQTQFEPPKIELRRVNKLFRARKEEVWAVYNVDMAVSAGEFVTIVGPSGCGKSTIFNIIAGLITPNSGDVLMDGKSTKGKSGHVGYMFQEDLLLPWRTVLENVVLGAELLGIPRREAEREAQALLADFGLKGFEHGWPSSLSGGMRQRAALMRTVLSHQDVMLLDEPFASLDAMTKDMMQEWLLEVWVEFKRTIVFITHDVDEAIFLADRIYVMTARPGTRKTEISVDLPRPRGSYQVKTTKEFIEIKHRVLEALRDEIVKSYGPVGVDKLLSHTLRRPS